MRLNRHAKQLALRMQADPDDQFGHDRGMIPMASGLGEGGDQTSPLGRAVIGGLFASTFAALLILPLVFAWVQGNTTTDSVSLILKIKKVNFMSLCTIMNILKNKSITCFSDY